MKLRPFELALVIIFSVLAVVSLFLIRTYSGDDSGSSNEDPMANVGKVVIWGTIPAEGIKEVLHNLSVDNKAYNNVFYYYRSPEELDSALLNALADNTGPDLLLISQEKLVKMRKRIQPISYESFPVRDIKNLYLDGAQVFALTDGLYGYPIAVDPLMMFWNRDILATEGYLEPPQTWETLINTMFPKLIKRDFDRTVERSVVAMGEYGNVRNAFGVISALMIQGGSQLVTENPDGNYLVKLQMSSNGGSDPLRAVADFYTRFSKPSNTLYSWNRSFSSDRQQFISSDLVLYFGYASEGAEIERTNPNLSFDIAEIPQGADVTSRRTYGKFYTLSLLQSSPNKTGASIIMADLGSSAMTEKIAIASNMVPAFRGLVNAGSNDVYGRVAYKSALITFGWLNPDRVASDKIFETMTKDINENREDLNNAVSDVSVRLGNEY